MDYFNLQTLLSTYYEPGTDVVLVFEPKGMALFHIFSQLGTHIIISLVNVFYLFQDFTSIIKC